MAVGQGEQLDGAAGERAGDIAAKLEHACLVILDQIVVPLGVAGRNHMVVLLQKERARREAGVEVHRAVVAFFERPAAGEIGIMWMDVIELAAKLEHVAGHEILDDVGAFLLKIGAAKRS